MTSTDNLEIESILNQKMKFIDAIQALPDNRDKRGKKHSQSFLIIVFIFSTLAGRSTISSIHRYMVNKMDWLREVTGYTAAIPISRSHIPRMLANLDWVALDQIITECFDDEIKEIIKNEWIGIDGKVMRGQSNRVKNELLFMRCRMIAALMLHRPVRKGTNPVK